MYYTNVKYGRQRRKEYPFICLETDTGPVPYQTIPMYSPSRAARHHDESSTASSDSCSVMEAAVLTAISSCISSGD